MFGEDFFGCFSADRSGVDQRDVGAQFILNEGMEEGIMGAAEQDSVDRLCFEWAEVLLDDGVGQRMVDIPFFNKRNEEGAEDGANGCRGKFLGDVVLVEARGDGGTRSQDSDMACCGGARNGFYTLLSNSNHGDVEACSEGVESNRTSGIAGDDEDFNSEMIEEIAAFFRVAEDCLRAFIPIRESCCIAKVDDIFLG